MTIHQVAGDALTARQVHDIWQIRDAVFAFEQRCDDVDVDGRDLLATTTHVWLADDAGLTSYLRSYVDADGVRHVGRVCTRRDARGRGLSGRLITHAHEVWGHERIDLGAQAHLAGWYAGFGYQVSGADYDDAGIRHTPMTRPPG